MSDGVAVAWSSGRWDALPRKAHEVARFEAGNVGDCGCALACHGGHGRGHHEHDASTLPVDCAARGVPGAGDFEMRTVEAQPAGLGEGGFESYETRDGLETIDRAGQGCRRAVRRDVA